MTPKERVVEVWNEMVPVQNGTVVSRFAWSALANPEMLLQAIGAGSGKSFLAIWTGAATGTGSEARCSLLPFAG